MSSSSGRKFTGTAIVVLALFGIGGALVDKMRDSGDDLSGVDTIPVAPLKTDSSPNPLASDSDILNSALVTQKPAFEVINLADDGTGTVAGKAVPGARIVLDVDGKATKVGEVSASGDFSLDLEQPLPPGKHILTLKSVGPKRKAPITSVHSIEVNINEGRESVVALLEPGKARLVLQGVEDSSVTGSVVADATEKVKKNAQAKLAETKAGIDKSAASLKNTTALAAQSAAGKLAPKASLKKAESSASKPEQRRYYFLRI